MSRRGSSIRPKTKPSETAKFYDQDDLEDAFDAEQNIANPFSGGQVSASSSKWSINESWRKLQQMIENRDKANAASKHKEPNSQELANFSNDFENDESNDLLDYSIHEGEEIQEGDTSYVPADSSYSDLSEERDASTKSGEISVSVPLNTAESTRTDRGNKHSQERDHKDNRADSSGSAGSEKECTATLSNSIKDNKNETKNDITPPPTRAHHVGMHKIQFSKIKKNCSIERINDDPDDKDAEKELLDLRRASKDDSLRGDLLSSTLRETNHQAASHPYKQPPQIKFSATPTRPAGSRSSSFSNTSTIKKRISERMNLSECEEEGSIDGFSTTGSSDKALFNPAVRHSTGKPVRQSIIGKSPPAVDEPIPSLPTFMSFIVDWVRKRFNFISFTSSFCTFFILIFAIQLSPLSSFANGFLIGILFCSVLLIIVIIYILNYIFVKIDYENDLHERIMSNQRWKKFPAYRKVQPDEKVGAHQPNGGVHEGWFFELVYSKKLGVDRLTAAEKTDYDKMPDTKLQLTYIKLEGTVMRLYVPKADQSKKLKPDMEKSVISNKLIAKMNQHIYDFSKMNHKKIQLWLPRNIINKKKYLFSRKFPFILTLEEMKRGLDEHRRSPDRRAPFALILFCRTNRDKEEWFNKFRQAIEMSDQNLKIQHLATAASTPDEVTHEQEAIPRTRSLDIGNISHEFEHLSNFLNYETFIQDLVSQSPYSPGGQAGGQTSGQQNGQSTNESGQPANINLFWFNALVGRVFFDFLTHAHWTRWVKLKIQRKLSRIKLPYFIQTITLKDVNLGTSMPKFLSVANQPLIDERGIWIDFDLDYQGCFSMTLETKLDLMKLKETKAPERELKPMKSPTLAGSQSTVAFDYDDLSDPESVVSMSDEDSEENLSIEADARQARFVKLLDKLVQHKYFQSATDTKFLKKKMEEVSNLPIQMTVHVYKLKGQLTLNLPPSPSDRLWYGFRTISEFQLTVEPSFGERTFSFAPIAQILSKKLKQEFHKILVLPNLDDIVLGNVMMGNEDIEIVDEVP